MRSKKIFLKKLKDREGFSVGDASTVVVAPRTCCSSVSSSRGVSSESGLSFWMVGGVSGVGATIVGGISFGTMGAGIVGGACWATLVEPFFSHFQDVPFSFL